MLGTLEDRVDWKNESLGTRMRFWSRPRVVHNQLRLCQLKWQSREDVKKDDEGGQLDSGNGFNEGEGGERVVKGGTKAML